MTLTIDNSNIQSFLKTETLLIIDEGFSEKNGVKDVSEILIQEIDNNKISVFINKVDLRAVKLTISKCKIAGFFVESAQIFELDFKDVVVNQYEDVFHKFTYKSYIDNSTIKTIRAYFSTFNYGFLIRNKSKVDDIMFMTCTIDLAFSHMNSESNRIELESSIIDNIFIENPKYPNESATSRVDRIFIFRNKVRRGIRIIDTPFREVQLHGVSLLKNETSTMYSNEVYISPPDDFKDIDKIFINESTIQTHVVISIHTTKQLQVFNSELDFFRLNFWEIGSHEIADCTFSGNVYYGFPSRLKHVDEFLIADVIFEEEFHLEDVVFLKRLRITGSKFLKYPSFFTGNEIEKECKVDFSYTNLSNLIFQQIDFRFFAFQTVDISNATFQDCDWTTRKELMSSRLVIVDEDNANSIDTLLKAKTIYAKLRSNLQKNENFIGHSLFYVSEQEVKRKIAKKNYSIAEWTLLTIHKVLSSYDENVLRPIMLSFVALIIFAMVYLFTGFYNGGELVDYEFAFSRANTSATFRDLGYSFIFSIRNLVPFNIGPSFFLSTDKSLYLTQSIEIIQRILNIIFLAAFTASMVKFLKK